MTDWFPSYIDFTTISSSDISGDAACRKPGSYCKLVYRSDLSYNKSHKHSNAQVSHKQLKTCSSSSYARIDFEYEHIMEQ